jgi:hypothetical protein
MRRRGSGCQGTVLMGSGVVDVCEVCVGQLVYCERYDADFCPVCDIWASNNGADCRCTYCADRPARPSGCRHPKRHPSLDE